MHARLSTGLATVDALLAHGWSSDQIQRAVVGHELTQVAPGLLVDGSVHPQHLAAIQDRWRPTCVTAAAAHGLWVPWSTDRRMHAYRVRTGKYEAPRSVVPHGWSHEWPEGAAIASVTQLLRHATRCLGPETIVVLAESALNKQMITPEDWHDIVVDAPVKKRGPLSRAVTTAQSGSETRVRFGLESHQIPVEAQKYIEGVGTVDLCVNDLWVIECDSSRHHSAEAAAIEDRRRDFALQSRGYFSTRLSYVQIWPQWPMTLDQLLAFYRSIRRRTRRPPMPGALAS